MNKCAERDRLLEALNEAAQHYAAVLDDLTRLMGTVGNERYQLMRNAVESANQEAEQAHKAYFAHLEKHGC